MERIRGEDRRVAMTWPETAELCGDLVGADPRRLEHRCSLGELGRRGGGRSRRGATLVIEAHALDPAAASQQRNPDQIPARRTPGRAAEGALGRRPAPRVVGQVLL